MGKALDGIADCEFAAAADWEILDLQYTPPEAEIVQEFHAAGGNDEIGLTQYALFIYWRNYGIAGVRANMREVPHTAVFSAPGTQLHLSAEARVKRYIALDHNLLAATSWGGGHEIVLDGYTPTDIEYVTYGEQRKMLWREWREVSEGVYTVAVIP